MSENPRMISILRRSLNLYYGEVENLGYGWRRRTRRSGQQDSTSTLVTRVQDGVEEAFVVNTAVFDWESEQTPPDLVSIHRATEQGLARINNLETDITQISVPDGKGWLRRLLPRDPDRSVGLAYYKDFLVSNQELFPVLEPGELFNEVAEIVLRWTGLATPTTARAHRSADANH
jgi:hypothetical protein